MNDEDDDKLPPSFGEIVWGLIKLAIALPLLWWLFPTLPIVRDIIALFH